MAPRFSQFFRQGAAVTEKAEDTVLFVHTAAVATCAGPPGGSDGGDPAGVIERAAVAVRGGVVVEVGEEGEMAGRHAGAERVDCGGGLLTPGLVDSHTHAVF